MAVTISEDVCVKNKTTVDEVLLLFLIHRKANVENLIKSLFSKSLIECNTDIMSGTLGDWKTNSLGINLINEVCVNSASYNNNDNYYESLANELKEIFPKGKREGTSYYWSDGVALIARRLKAFEKKYGKFSKEDIVDAAKKYVESFNGDYRYMKLLKYFIFKDKVGDEVVENESMLLTMLEHKDDKDFNPNWSSELV